jgi:hypothetical protein
MSHIPITTIPFIETGAGQVGFEFTIFLPVPPKWWDYRYAAHQLTAPILNEVSDHVGNTRYHLVSLILVNDISYC